MSTRSTKKNKSKTKSTAKAVATTKVATTELVPTEPVTTQSLATAKRETYMTKGASSRRRVLGVVVPDLPRELPMTTRAWKFWGCAILLVAAIVRLWNLDMVPFHHDEGVNGNFLMTLYRDGIYRYDPTNYHGPTIYYFALVFARIATFLFGNEALNDITMRLVPAVFGIGTIWLVLCLRRFLGAWATLIAAALLALSPGMVYISRYFIHEMHFVFFTLAAVVAMLRYRETRGWYWPAVATSSLAMLFASKETAPISIIVILVAWGMTCGIARFSRQMGELILPPQIESDKNDRDDATLAEASDVEASTRVVPQATSTRAMTVFASVLLSIAAFIFITVVLFTSFGTNDRAESIRNFFEAYKVWGKTGQKDQGAAFSQYLWWMLVIETPILVLGIVGIGWNLWERRQRFGLFAALWAGGLWLGYSLIPYKTPWLMINFVLPLALVAGWTIQRIAEIAWASTRSWKPTLRLVSPLVIIALLLTSWQSWMLNVVHYDNDGAWKLAGNNYIKKYPYVYVHTMRSTKYLLSEIDRIAEISGQGKAMPIGVYADEYWPLPWYFRSHVNADGSSMVGFTGRVVTPGNEVVIISRNTQDIEMTKVADANYVRKGEYELRPGVMLVLWVRRDFADK